jgi:hypothetical protein
VLLLSGLISNEAQAMLIVSCNQRCNILERVGLRLGYGTDGGSSSLAADRIATHETAVVSADLCAS